MWLIVELEHFRLEKYDFLNNKHIQLKEQIINSEDAELISRDIDNYIKRNSILGSNDNITNTYTVIYDNTYIGLIFINYHQEEIRNNQILPEEIEIGIGLLPVFRGKNLGSILERELCEKLFKVYPKFTVIVARIDEKNIRSIRAAIKAGFEYFKDDEYHYKRK